MPGYIVLETSDASISKRFRVVHGSYKRSMNRTRNIQKTITGYVDVQEGLFTKMEWQMTIQIVNDDEVEYGTLDDLINILLLVNPLATPTNKLTFEDFESDSHTVILANMQQVDRLLGVWDRGRVPSHVPIALLEV